MPGIIIIVALLALLVLFAVVGFAAHLLFSPWVLLAAIIVIAWAKFRPARGRR
jgi:hypothetical protein